VVEVVVVVEEVVLGVAGGPYLSVCACLIRKASAGQACHLASCPPVLRGL